MSIPLSKFLGFLYSNFDFGISIYGLFLFITNLLVILGTSNFVKYSRNEISLIAIFTFNMLIIPINILGPTFTISSISSTGVGIMGIILYYKNLGNKWYTYSFYFLLIVLGYLIRTEAFIGVLVFILPFCLYSILTHEGQKKYNKNLILIFSIIFGIIIALQNYLLNLTSKNSIYSKEFLEFNELRSLLSYTPPFLKMHQEIISGKILQGIWSNVDFILLRDWVYADNSIYNSRNLQLAINSISEEFGFSGLLRSDFSFVIGRLFSETYNLIFIPISFILILVTSNLFIFFNRSQFLSILVLSLSYFMGFYYLSSVLRLPVRTTFPILLLLLLAIVLILKSESFATNPKNNFILTILFVILNLNIFNFYLNNDFGFRKIMRQNETKLENSDLRDKELLSYSKTAIYVGPISFFPISTDFAYSESKVWESNAKTLTLSWATFSPSWRNLAINLGLDPNNIYNSLAKKNDVYWVSNSTLAEILNMYMNDHKIYRGKLCSVAKLSGPDQAEIFTYQAKEDDC